MRALAAELLRGASHRRGELVQLVLSLAALDAPSGAGADALAPAADQLADELSSLGSLLTRTPGPQGELLELDLGPSSGDHALILGHYDTVWPAGTAERRPARLADGATIHGPGVFDMRAGIACAIVGLRLLEAERLPIRTVILLSPDEETGSATSRERILAQALSARWILVLEPPLPGGALKTARSGWAVYRLTATGRAAHAGIEPERGVNAIEELCDAIVNARRLAAPERGTTINAGVIGGGDATNAVPAEAHALFDVRARSGAEQERVDAGFHALAPVRAGASLVVERLHIRPAMERTPAIAGAVDHARAAAALLNIDLRDGAVGGTSDANLFALRGVPVLDGLGPEGGGAHAEDEHVFVDSLVERAGLVALLAAWPPGAKSNDA